MTDNENTLQIWFQMTAVECLLSIESRFSFDTRLQKLKNELIFLIVDLIE